MATRAQVVEQLEQIEAKYGRLMVTLHPSLNIYQEIKYLKADVHDLLSEIAEGKYDKEPDINWEDAFK
jgi:hypothetical protein